MKLIILTITVVFCSLTYGETYSSRRNIYGGQNYYSGGRYIGQSRPNIYRGSNYYNSSGRFMMRSYPSSISVS